MREKKKTVAIDIWHDSDGIHCYPCTMYDSLFSYCHIYQDRGEELLFDDDCCGFIRCQLCREDPELVLVFDKIQYADKINHGRIYPKRKFGIGVKYIVKEELTTDLNYILQLKNMMKNLSLLEKFKFIYGLEVIYNEQRTNK